MTKTNQLFTSSLLPHGNGKLLDYDNPENGEKIRYAQFNTRAVIDCPFHSKGCQTVCYATKGNHIFPSVIKSREKSFATSKENDFVDKMIYTISYHMTTKRYRDAVMLVRIHESGDFYSLQYLKKWIKVWKEIASSGLDVRFVFYTKSFRFFNMLEETEKEIIRSCMKAGKVSINLSLDDTTTKAQKQAYLAMITNFPMCNTYYCTENVDAVKHDNVCDCADCAKCGKCNTATATKTVVKIHSASNADMEEYRKNAEKG